MPSARLVFRGLRAFSFSAPSFEVLVAIVLLRFHDASDYTSFLVRDDNDFLLPRRESLLFHEDDLLAFVWPRHELAPLPDGRADNRKAPLLIAVVVFVVLRQYGGKEQDLLASELCLESFVKGFFDGHRPTVHVFDAGVVIACFVGLKCLAALTLALLSLVLR